MLNEFEVRTTFFTPTEQGEDDEVDDSPVMERTFTQLVGHKSLQNLDLLETTLLENLFLRSGRAGTEVNIGGEVSFGGRTSIQFET